MDLKMIRLILIAVFLPGLLAASEIKHWQDDNGQNHFGDRPPTGVASSPVTVNPNVYSAPERATPVPRAARSAPAKNAAKVVMYSTSWCPYCARARAYFKANKVTYTEYDIETTAKGTRDYARLNGSGVPVIMVGEKRLNGFNIGAFESVYRP